jgi:5'-nucleotidase
LAIRPGRIPVIARAVLFDLDDTLFDHRGCSRDALLSVQKAHDAFGVMPLDDLESAHSRVLEELHADVMLGRVPLEQARMERFRRLMATSGGTPREEDVARIAAEYRDRYKQVRRAVRGAGDLLEALSTRTRIGIVSNNLFDEQREKLAECGLAPYVHALVVSERVGVSKPDPVIFVAALDALQCRAADAVMVGDSWSADIAGARAASIRPIWFNPLGANAPAGEAVAELRSLEPTDAVAEMILAGGATS